MRLKWLKWLVIAVGATLFVGGGAYAGMQWLGQAPEHDALELAPPDSVFYANAFLDPSMNQKMALKAVLAKLPRYDTPDEASQALTSLFDKGLREVNLSFEADVQPWLGDEVAAFASGDGRGGEPRGSFAVLFAAEDTDAALDALSTGVANAPQDFTEQSYKGADYQFDAAGDSALGMIESFVVAGNEAGFKAAVEASKGESLSGSLKYKKATAGLTKDRLALFFYDGGAALSSLQGSGGVGAPFGAVAPLGAAGIPQEPGAGVLFARPDGFVLEASTPLPEDGASRSLIAHAGEPGLVPSLPRDSWAAAGVPQFGDALRSVADSFGGMGMLEQQFGAQTGLDLDKDVLGWMGDLGVSVEGSTMTELSGGVVIESRAPQTSFATVAAIGRLAARQGVPVKPLELGGARGFSIKDPSMPKAINVVAGDNVVIAYGDDATRELLDPRAGLSEDPRFRAAAEALGEDFNPTGFVNVPGLVGFVESEAGTSSDAHYNQEIKPLVDAASYVVFGARVGNETVVQRVVIGIE